MTEPTVLRLPESDEIDFDIRALMRAVGGVHPEVPTAPAPRDAWYLPVVEHAGDSAPIAEPPVPAVFIDGIQSRLLLGVRSQPPTIPGDRRPVFLEYAAAAAVGDEGTVLHHCARWWISASTLDGPWVASLPPGPPAWLLGETLAETIVPAADRLVHSTRLALEDEALAAAGRPVDGLIVVDGSIHRRRPHRRLAGIVKSSGARLCTDETALRTLPPGWRSRTVTMVSGHASEPDVHAAYVRLHEPTGADWTEGLVRVETFDPALLDTVAAVAWHGRQPATSGDPRWDRHIAPVAHVERVARARRPNVYTL